MRQTIFFIISLVIALGYGALYFRHELGVSPFHISARLPGLDMMILLVTVIAPLIIGLTLGTFAGKLRWFVLPLYPMMILLSLF